MRPKRHYGFTLVEIMVVLVIVSVMAGITVANMPQFAETADLDEEAKRVNLLLKLARDEAIVTGYEYGFQATDKGYEFLQYDEAEQKWVAKAEAPFKPRTLPEELNLTLDVEGEALFINPDEKKKAPDILLLSSGETSEFTLYLELRDNNDLFKALKADGYGSFSWQEETL